MANRWDAFTDDELLDVWLWWLDENTHGMDKDGVWVVGTEIAGDLYDALVLRNVEFAKYHPNRPCEESDGGR